MRGARTSQAIGCGVLGAFLLFPAVGLIGNGIAHFLGLW